VLRSVAEGMVEVEKGQICLRKTFKKVSDKIHSHSLLMRLVSIAALLRRYSPSPHPLLRLLSHVSALPRACTYDLSPLSTCTCNLTPSGRITLPLSRLLTCLENFDHTQPSNHSRSPQDYSLRNKMVRLAPLGVL
jgi:hypothetical protein